MRRTALCGELETRTLVENTAGSGLAHVCRCALRPRQMVEAFAALKNLPGPCPGRTCSRGARAACMLLQPTPAARSRHSLEPAVVRNKWDLTSWQPSWRASSRSIASAHFAAPPSRLASPQGTSSACRSSASVVKVASRPGLWSGSETRPAQLPWKAEHQTEEMDEAMVKQNSVAQDLPASITRPRTRYPDVVTSRSSLHS
mmetsp:Transcript_78041/g.196141  ORF Transcript_78041/g.196141 Transcript_78041/m.196141 type:complete len:201 (+) Transcript_78041:105-707(+)